MDYSSKPTFWYRYDLFVFTNSGFKRKSKVTWVQNIYKTIKLFIFLLLWISIGSKTLPNQHLDTEIIYLDLLTPGFNGKSKAI